VTLALDAVVWKGVALGVFVLVWLGVALRLVIRGRAAYDADARIPLEDDGGTR
jgi:hypothetical protein